jgi:ubiquinone/menaquinone biosynthesis C-methylase UbiE
VHSWLEQVPLDDNSINVAIYCLSLMGTNYIDFLKEAHRVLRNGGALRIAEVKSRFSDVDEFIASLQPLGFKIKHKVRTLLCSFWLAGWLAALLTFECTVGACAHCRTTKTRCLLSWSLSRCPTRSRYLQASASERFR